MSLVIPLLAIGDVKGSFALRIVYTYADFQLWVWVCMYVVLPVHFNVTRNVGVPHFPPSCAIFHLSFPLLHVKWQPKR